jgi:regulator of protease activity HflC (stomatin/prohibitin superfamily)
MELFAGFVLVFLVFAVILVFLGVKIVPQSEKWTVERFGRYTRTVDAGMHVIVPVVDRIGAKLSLREQVLDIAQQEVITKDNALISADGVVFFQIMDAEKTAYQIEDLYRALTNLTQTNIRSVLGSLELDQLLSNRDEINDRLLVIVNEASDPWGVRITRVEL